MIYNWRGCGLTAGTVPGPHPAKLYDADGVEIDLPVREANMDTGRVCFLKLDAAGKPMIDWDHDCAMEETRMFKPPLNLVQQ